MYDNNTQDDCYLIKGVYGQVCCRAYGYAYASCSKWNFTTSKNRYQGVFSKNVTVHYAIFQSIPGLTVLPNNFVLRKCTTSPNSYTCALLTFKLR